MIVGILIGKIIIAPLRATSIIRLVIRNSLIIWGFIEINFLLFIPVIGLIEETRLRVCLGLSVFIQSLTSLVYFK